MGACEPGQARDRAAISGNFHVPGFSLKAVFFLRPDDFSAFFPSFLCFGGLIPAASPSRRFPPPTSEPRSTISLPHLLYFTVKTVFFLDVLKNFAEFAKKSDKIAPRRLFYRAFRLK